MFWYWSALGHSAFVVIYFLIRSKSSFFACNLAFLFLMSFLPKRIQWSSPTYLRFAPRPPPLPQQTQVEPRILACRKLELRFLCHWSCNVKTQEPQGSHISVCGKPAGSIARGREFCLLSCLLGSAFSLPVGSDVVIHCSIKTTPKVSNKHSLSHNFAGQAFQSS